MPVEVFYPLLNPNETEAMLAAVHVTEGQHVAAGDLLFTLETTKSTAEVAAEAGGFVAGLRARRGETVSAGELFCYLAESADWKPPDRSPTQAGLKIDRQASVAGRPTDLPIPEGLRITRPALALARREGLDLSALPIGPLVTERMVREAAGPGAESETLVYSPVSGKAHILIYGGGGHGKALIDLLRTLGVYQLAGVVDDGFPAGETVMGLPVLGGRGELAQLYAQGLRLAVNAVGGIGNIQVRIKVFRTLAEAGFTCPTLIHPSAWVEASASLADGVQVFPHAYVGSEARVGFGSIINTGAIVSHDCVLGETVNISPGAILAGEVHVGDGALVGMGVTVNLQVKIGAGARVGNSATLKGDVPPNGIVRAGTTYPER